MSGFDDFLGRVNETWGEKPRDPDAPVRWEYTTVNVHVKKKAKTLQRMAAKGWEYVEETKTPFFSLQPPLALTFKRQK